MKRLYIIRHAKSDWNNNLKDFDRPLNGRGESDAPKMGKHLKAANTKVDHIISSPAKRAITTAQKIAKELSFDLDTISTNKNLYHASANTILDIINNIPDEHHTVMIFGHNPGLSYICSELTGQPIELKTCCVCELEIAVENWAAISRDSCFLKQYISPKSI